MNLIDGDLPFFIDHPGSTVNTGMVLALIFLNFALQVALIYFAVAWLKKWLGRNREE